MGRTAGTNIRIVAKAAGVSPATASRALNGNTSVNAELTQRVLEAANKLGYPIHNELRKKNIVFIMQVYSTSYSLLDTGSRSCSLTLTQKKSAFAFRKLAILIQLELSWLLSQTPTPAFLSQNWPIFQWSLQVPEILPTAWSTYILTT